MKTSKGKLKVKKIKIPNKIRLGIVGIFAIIFIISMISLANAYQKSATIQKETPTVEYNQVGDYNYVAYINKSIVYEGIETLQPGEGIIFKDLTKNINATFMYRLSINKDSEISGKYTVTAQITTDLWSKTYTLISENSFNSNGTSALFFVNFPIDYLFYENITSQIEDETGVIVDDAMLIIQTDIELILITDGEIIHETLNPTLSLKLNKATINIEFGTDNRDSGQGTPIIEEVTNQNVIDERNTWTIFFIISLVLLIFSSILLLRRGEKLTISEKENKKITKKYKEWIVDIDTIPKKADSNILQVKSIEDLMKISEEIGKPVFHYLTEEDKHSYYVLDESITYQYLISKDGKKTKIVICPKCHTKIECKGTIGEKLHVICPKCNKEGDIKI